MKKKIIAIIPARLGSKGIPHKNIKELAGKPLIAHSIEHGLKCPLIDRVIVSTDSYEYGEIARKYGAEVPFLRPSKISHDTATDLEAFEHLLKWFNENENYIPDICVHLRPTTPIRNIDDIENMINILVNNDDLDSVRSVTNTEETPYKMWHRDGNGILSPLIHGKIKDAWNLPRQLLPQKYIQNASIDVIRTQVIFKKKSMAGDKIYGYLMEKNFDIDTVDQFDNASQFLEDKQRIGEMERKTFCFDIDGVIASIVDVNDYDKAQPLVETINIINQLYAQGHYIILFTARGYVTGIDWKETTKSQMETWKVKYHELKFGKPAADYYIDDKFISIFDLKMLINEKTSGGKNDF